MNMLYSATATATAVAIRCGPQKKPKNVLVASALIWRRNATSWSTNPDYQYLQRSEIPTLHFQPSLPRLPVPKLEKTCERFLNAVQPIQSADEFERIKSIVQTFENGEGKELQKLLQSHDSNNKHTSYISEPWFDMYLSDRAPLPLNYNPLLVMKPETRPAYRDQLVRATNLIVSSLQFWRALKSNCLAPEVYHMNPQKTNTKKFNEWLRYVPKPVATYFAYAFKAFPLDMSQYERLFGVTRIPELHKDRLVSNPDAKHLLVLRRGNLYAMHVLDADGNLEPPHIINNRLRQLVKLDGERKAASLPLGVLTAGERDNWARTRQHLIEIAPERHGQLFEKIDSALFCLCLDAADDPTYSEVNPIPYFKHLLAGVGTNRWFDKSVSLIVSADGNAAINFEHSWGDGVAVLRYFNEIYKATIERPYISRDDTGGVGALDDAAAIEEINFDMTKDECIRADINTALQQNKFLDDQLDIQMLRYAQLNKNVGKRAGVSPDAIMQLSFQLAYRLAFNDYVGSYESCSTAAFRHGRTETIRPCTNATKQFCESILNSKGQANVNELREQMRNCSTIHGQLTKEAAMGQGFDRHLFALKTMANIYDRPKPELFATSAYAKINYNIISTSTLSSDALLAGAFGPVVKDGLGIGYSMQNDECGAIVSSYRQKRDGSKFIHCLAEAFDRIRAILLTK